jgi:hypothetical protein
VNWTARNWKLAGLVVVVIATRAILLRDGKEVLV